MRKRSNFNHFYYNLQIPYHTTDWKTAIWTQIQISCQTYPSGRKTAQETFQTSGRSTSNSYPVHIRMITRWSCYQLTCHKSFSIRSSAHCWHDQCQTGLGIKGFYKRFGKSAFLLKHHSPPAVHRQPLPPQARFKHLPDSQRLAQIRTKRFKIHSPRKGFQLIAAPIQVRQTIFKTGSFSNSSLWSSLKCLRFIRPYLFLIGLYF